MDAISAQVFAGATAAATACRQRNTTSSRVVSLSRHNRSSGPLAARSPAPTTFQSARVHLRKEQTWLPGRGTIAVEAADPGLSPTELAKAEAKAAADTIDRIVRTVVKEMMVSEGVALIAGDEKADVTLQEAIDKALKEEADLLNETFLMTIMKFTEAARERGQTDMADLLVRVYESTIKYVTAKMPPEMRLLSSLLEESSGEKRDQMLRTAVQATPQGAEGTSQCDLEALAITTTRMVEDMEARQIVVDRNLLVRMCLVREEIRKLAMELKGMQAPEVVKFETVIPGRVSHFIKELMPVTEPGRRMALLEKVFRGDWEGAAPNAKLTQKQKINRSKFGSPEDNIPDVVRPGSLLSALLRLQIAMESDKEKLSINKTKIQRVAEIRHEAVHVMKRVAFR